MGDLNSFNNIDDISPQKKSKALLPGDIGLLEGRSTTQLEESHVQGEIEAQIADTDSIFNLRTLDQATREQLSQYAKMYCERRRISEPSIQALFQYHFQELLRNMQRDYDLYLMDKKLEELTMRQFGIMPEDLEKFKF